MKLKPSTVTDLHFYCLSSFLLRLLQKNERMEMEVIPLPMQSQWCITIHCVRLCPFPMLSFYEWMCQLAQKNSKQKRQARERKRRVLVLKKSVKISQARRRNKSRTFTETCSEAMICWHCSHCAIAESREWTKTEMKKKASKLVARTIERNTAQWFR